MLSGLPKLLGKSFIIGYVLPATLFILFVSIILTAFDVRLPTAFGSRPETITELLKLIESSLLVILLSIVLLAVNPLLERQLQGYHHPIKFFFEARAKEKFRRNIAPVLNEMNRIDEEKRASAGPVTPRIENFGSKLYHAVLNYPDEEEWVLATRFGNIIRATEVYPRVVYGLDGVPAWPHLLMLLPKDVDEKLKDSRSIVDFLMNTFALSVILVVVYFCLAVANCSFEALWVPPVLLVAVVMIWMFLPAAARQWGFSVKAVYDLYRSELATKLGFKLPSTAESEMEFWQHVSKMMIFRSTESLRLNNAWRLPPESAKPKGPGKST